MSEQTGAEPADSLFDHYPLGVAYDEMLAEPGSPAHRLQAGLPHPARDDRPDAQGARRHPRPLLPRPGRHLRLRGGGAALSPRRRAPGHLGARVAGHRVGRRAARHGARVVPRRHLLPRGRDPARRARGRHPVAAHRELEALPPRRHGRSAPPTACGCTSPGSTSSATRQGTFRVLEDNVRVPSGVSYVIANRRAMANVFPEAFATMRIRPGARLPADAARGAARRRPPTARATRPSSCSPPASSTPPTSSTPSSPG